MIDAILAFLQNSNIVEGLLLFCQHKKNINTRIVWSTYCFVHFLKYSWSTLNTYRYNSLNVLFIQKCNITKSSFLWIFLPCHYWMKLLYFLWIMNQSGTYQRIWIWNTLQQWPEGHQTVVCLLFALSNQPDIVVQVIQCMVSVLKWHLVVYLALAYSMFSTADYPPYSYFRTLHVHNTKRVYDNIIVFILKLCIDGYISYLSVLKTRFDHEISFYSWITTIKPVVFTLRLPLLHKWSEILSKSFILYDYSPGIFSMLQAFIYLNLHLGIHPCWYKYSQDTSVQKHSTIKP